MKCPECKSDGAYTGLQWVHCQNKKCKYYDARYTAEVTAENRKLSAAERLILIRELVEMDREEARKNRK